MAISINFFLDFCTKSEFPDEQLIVLSTSQSLVAEALCKATETVNSWLLAQGFSKALLYYPECRGKPYQFDGTFSTDTKSAIACVKNNIKKSSMTNQINNSGVDEILAYLKNADEVRVLEFVKEKIVDGLIVIITSQLDDRCRFTSKSLRPERAFWSPSQFHGYNYLLSWDVDRVGQPSNEYHTMRQLLDRDNHIPGYNYKLIRPDGALCEYSTDYYHVADGWCGEPIRIGVSRPEDWRLLVPA